MRVLGEISGSNDVIVSANFITHGIASFGIIATVCGVVKVVVAVVVMFIVS